MRFNRETKFTKTVQNYQKTHGQTKPGGGAVAHAVEYASALWRLYTVRVHYLQNTSSTERPMHLEDVANEVRTRAVKPQSPNPPVVRVSFTAV